MSAAGHDYGSPGPTPPDLKAPLASSQQDFENLVLACNKEGMDYLRKAQYKEAFEQLKYAEAILVARQGEDERSNLLAVTCNNLGCYYKKVNKLHAALSYLRKALKIEVSLQTDDVTVAGTHLNICAILSKLDKHDRAVQHALCALELISARVSAVGNSATQDEYSVLAIAYHNVAVERDYLHDWEAAAQAYKQGHQIAKQCLGEHHPLTQTLGKNSDAAMQKSLKVSKERTLSSSSRRPGKPPLAPDMGGGATSSSGPLLGGAAGSAGSLPDIGNTPRTAAAEEQAPIPTSRAGGLRREAAEWASSEEAAAGSWQAAGGGVAPAAQQQLRAPSPFRGGAGSVAPSPRPPPSAGSQLFNAAPQGQWPAELGAASGAAPSPSWAHQSSFLEGAAELQALQAPPPVPATAVPAARPASPPPLILMGHEKQRRAREDRTRPAGAEPLDASQASQDLDETRGNAPRAFGGTFGTSRNTKGHTPARIQRDLMRAQNSRSGAEPPQPGPKPSQLLRKSAAYKIQVAWRAHWKHKTMTKDRMERERIAATMIQSTWRAFHVRRTKMNRVCTTIQRHLRGYFVRIAIRRHNAAVIMQRHARGWIFRRQLREMAQAALKIQRVARGKEARQKCLDYEASRLRAAMVLQKIARMWKAQRLTASVRKKKAHANMRLKGALVLQSFYRGQQGRKAARKAAAERKAEQRERWAATKIQSMARGKQATKRVDIVRNARNNNMHRAATNVRKHWLAHIQRKRYLELRADFQTHEPSVVTIQRYARGFLVRLRMWREAIRAEEELWAAVEIQRCWRGHLGRVRWELAYEAVWSREAAARRLQRYVRGWLARTRVHRLRKRNARAEFQRARRRFKAAQKIQALARGDQARKRVEAHRQRIYHAATTIQRHYRGHRFRCHMWELLQAKRVVQIQAAARGFLVRRRKLRLLAHVIMVQRRYKQWLKLVPQDERHRRLAARRQRTPAGSR